MEYAIQMKNVSKFFGEKRALADVSISVNHGEILGFLGPSGAGKTTTIKILTGQLKESGGEATILNHNVRMLNNEIYSQIGIVTDNSGLYENMSAYDNLLLFSRILKTDRKELSPMLERVGLLNDAKKKVKLFSRGMKQRLVLARAMLHHPKILFLDEPTSGLDPATQVEIHELMLEMKHAGTTFFLTTHNMTEASKLCDRIALFNEGKIADLGTLDELSQKYNGDRKVNILLKSGENVVIDLIKENSSIISDWISKNEIITIHSQEPTLEKIFLKVTGRGLQ